MSRGLRGCLRSGAPHVEGPRDKLACPKGISSLATVSEFERTIVLMHMKRFATVAFFLIASWLLTLPTGEVVKHFAEESPLRGAIPYLLAPGVICLYSSTVQLLIVVLFGVMAVIIADIAKLIIRSAWAWLVILLFQGVLVLDVLRAYGGEWWTYFAMLVGITPAPAPPGGVPQPPISAVRWPWIAATASAVAIILLLLIARAEQRKIGIRPAA